MAINTSFPFALFHGKKSFLRKMKTPFRLITFFLIFFFLSSALLHFNQCYAKERTPSSSLVLSLTRSKNSLSIPKSSYNSVKKTFETLDDIMEPLREVRDGYLITLNLGTPPQIIQVYMDTGSDLTWVPCGNLSFDCIDCDDYKNHKLMSSFSPSFSSSSSRDFCDSHSCINIHSSDNAFDQCTVAGCSLSSLLKGTCSRPCPSFAYTYGEGVVTGTLTRDTLRVHSNPNSNIREVQKFVFGCVGTTYREPIGIVGFGKGPLSLPSQLGFLQKGFSHCFLPFKFANNPNMSSPLVVGQQAISSKENFQFTPMLKSSMYPNFYYIGLEAITVGNGGATAQVPLALREVDSLGNGGMLIDSGTTYTHLPEPFYSNLLTALESSINYPRAEEVEARTGFDLCYKLPCPSNNINTLATDDFPLITFHFLNNVSLVLPNGNNFYAMGAPRNSTVVKCLLFQSMEDSEEGPAGIFGSFQQQNVEVVYDLEKERIGFQNTDCAAAAASHGLHKK
ncbi:putative aspartyl protease At4g16563 [Nicotiana tabacum]|uniref:Aspartic proteinase nepenthesin-1 n=1 Tax=Nicotiana sylvestris TaxID=4096 RepID=A0A1U7YB52_NICSY|nr:PREDICTED: aspartic proteinase nepenthesin-1 [Nicotiana sylvestris]